MNKENALHELFMTMKVSLKNAAMYNQDHPAFQKAVTEVKERVDILFEYMSPIEISFSPHALLVENKFWDEEKMYQELGRIFHFRKVKKFKVSRGVTLSELMVFMSHISLTPRDIFNTEEARLVGVGIPKAIRLHQVLKSKNIELGQIPLNAKEAKQLLMEIFTL